MHPPKKWNLGKTATETALALAALAIVAFCAKPAFEYVQTLKKRQTVTLTKTLNEAANRARLLAMEGPGTTGIDKSLAISWYKEKNLIPKDKTIDTQDIWFLDGIWAQDSLPSKSEDALELLSAKILPEKNMEKLLTHFGATSTTGLLNRIQETYCQPIAVTDLLQRDYQCKSLKELQQRWGMKSIAEVAQTGFKKSNQAELEAWLKETAAKPPFATPEEALLSWFGSDNAQTVADQSFENPSIPDIPVQTAQEFGARWGDYPPIPGKKIYEAITIALPYRSALIPLHLGFLHHLKEVEHRPDEQEILFDMLVLGSQLNCLEAMDFSKLSLAGRSLSGLKLSGSNLTGSQLDEADLAFSDLSGMNLTGLNPNGKSLRGTNLSNTKGLLIFQILSATDLKDTNLSGIDFQHANLAGKDISGTIIQGAANLSGEDFNGVGCINNATLENLDLTKWSILPYSGSGKSSVKSFKGSQLAPGLLTKNQLARNACLENVDLTDWKPNLTSLDYQLDLTGARLPAENLNMVAQFPWTNFGEMDMTKFEWRNKALGGCNLSKVRGLTGTNLNLIASAHLNGRGLNLQGQNLSGWRPTYSIQNSILANTSGLTAENLAVSSNILGIDLTNSGVTKKALSEAISALGKDPESGNMNVNSVKF